MSTGGASARNLDNKTDTEQNTERNVSREKPQDKQGRPVLSLFALYARSSFCKILAAFAGLAVAEGISFAVVCRGLGQNDRVLYPEKMIDMCFFRFIFLAALALVYFILVVTEGERNGCKSSYTLLRLKISKMRQFAVRMVYNFLCLTLVFAVQILAAFVFCRLYEAKMPAELVSPQYLFLVFYRNAFLHCVLPMADVGKWVCNFLLILALAMDAACGGSLFGSRKSKGGSIGNDLLRAVLIYCILPQWFVSEIHSSVAVLYALFSLVMIGVTLIRLFGVMGGNRDEEA